jgi:hypothetical protein
MQPDFRHTSIPAMASSPGRESHCVPVYLGDRQKWTFHFVLALLNEFMEEWAKVGRTQRSVRSGHHGTRTVMKWWNRTRGAIVKVTFSDTWQITVEVFYH